MSTSSSSTSIDYLLIGQESNASDVHLGVNMPPLWRRNGNLEPIFRLAPRLTEEDTKKLAHSFLDEAQLQRLEEQGDVDFAYSTSFGRFRTSVIRQRLGIDLVFRVISTNLRTMDELGLPQSLKKLTEYHNGLVLVTGPVGSGKSTTLAAMVQEINLQRKDHIITLEDPIEYIIKSTGCHVTQREVHSHTRSFAAALRGALREDPDVIMVGEMRDLETIALAISASALARMILQANLSRPDLSPELIAGQMLVSRSTLYRLFEPEGGVMHFVQGERLRAVRDALADPMERRTIGRLAEVFGFSSISQLSRSFRGHYGAPPQAWRGQRRVAQRIDGRGTVQHVWTWLRENPMTR